MLSEPKLEQYQQKQQQPLQQQSCPATQNNDSHQIQQPTQQKKEKKWKIPDPDEVFMQLEMEKTLQTIPFKKKVEQNIAALTSMMEFEIITNVDKENEQMLESETRKTVSIRQQLGNNKDVKAIIFEKNEGLFEQTTNPDFPGDLSAIRQSRESEQESEYNFENLVKKQLTKGDSFKDNKKITEQDFTQEVLTKKTHFQIIVAACLARTISVDQYRKYKIQLDDENLVINKKYTIPLAAITKIKIIYELIRPELKITFMDKMSKQSASKHRKKYGERSISMGNVLEQSDQEDKFKKDAKSVENVLFLCDGFEFIYTLFASIIVRKLYQEGMNIPEPIQVNSFLMKVGVSESYHVCGVIEKLSRHVKKWEERYGEIKEFKYLSSQIKQKKKMKEKTRNSGEGSTINKDTQMEQKEIVVGKCTVKVDKIKELWTRFETHHGKLIVKFFQGRQKFELGIPLHNYADIVGEGNWLYGLLTVLRGPD